MGKSHSEVLHLWKRGVLVRLGDSVTGGDRGTPSRVLEEVVCVEGDSDGRRAEEEAGLGAEGPENGSERLGGWVGAGDPSGPGHKERPWGGEGTGRPDPWCPASADEEQVSCACGRAVRLGREGGGGKVPAGQSESQEFSEPAAGGSVQGGGKAHLSLRRNRAGSPQSPVLPGD